MYCQDSAIGDNGAPMARQRRLEHVQCGLLSGADKFDTTLCHSDFEGLAMEVLVKTPLLTTLHVGLEGDVITLFAVCKG